VHELAEAVDEAMVGDLLADSPEAQPDRLITASDFPSLYVRHRSALRTYARRYLSDAHDIEDVVQETYLKLFLAIPELETELQALAFSRRVLTNLCIDRYRAAKRRPSVINLDTGVVEEVGADTELADPVVRAEDAALVRQALARLSPLHRSALVKREIEEKSLAVIATELGIPEHSVKHLLFRARRAMRKLLVGSSVDPETPMTTVQVLSVANRRAGARVVQTGHYVVIVLVFLAIGVVVSRTAPSQLWLSDGPVSGSSQLPAAGEPTQPGQGSLPSPAGSSASRGSTPAPVSGDPSGTPSATGRAPSVVTGTVAPSTPGTSPSPSSPSTSPGTPQQSQPPASTEPSGGPTPPPPTGAGGPALALTGDLQATGAPAIVDQQRLPTQDSSSVLFSQFVVPTTAGQFSLKQIVSQTAGQSPVTFTAQVPVAGQSLPTSSRSSSSGAFALPGGGTLLTGSLSVVPLPQALAQSVSPAAATPTQISVSLVVSPDGGSVVSESVDVHGGATSLDVLPSISPTTSPSSGPNGRVDD
jgi:RNA polymerase sigma-70 factor (ECF subfamily)